MSFERSVVGRPSERPRGAAAEPSAQPQLLRRLRPRRGAPAVEFLLRPETHLVKEKREEKKRGLVKGEEKRERGSKSSV